MARLNCVPPENMSFREFTVHCDNIKKDIEKEEEERRKAEARASGGRRF